MTDTERLDWIESQVLRHDRTRATIVAWWSGREGPDGWDIGFGSKTEDPLDEFPSLRDAIDWHAENDG